MKSAVHVLLGHRNHQAEVGLHQVLLGALSFGFPVPDYGQRVLQIGQTGTRHGLPLADFLLQVLQPLLDLRLAGCLHLDLLGLAIQLAQFLDGALDLLGEFLPSDGTKGDRSNPQRHLHLGPVQAAAPALALLLQVYWNGLHLLGDLLQLSVYGDQIGEQFQQIGAFLEIGWCAFLNVAYVHYVVDLVGTLLQLLGQLHHHPLH